MFGKVLFLENCLTNSILCKVHFFLVYCTIILLCYYFQTHVFESILMCVYYGLFGLYVLSPFKWIRMDLVKLNCDKQM